MNGTSGGAPHDEIAIRAPGFRKPRMRPAVASASGSKMIPQRETAASKLAAGRSSFDASHSMNSRFARPAADARSRAWASIAGEMSVATTLPSGPTLRAAVSAGSPRPAATSSTRLPGSTPASSTSRSLTCPVHSSICFAHLSHPVAALFQLLRCAVRNSPASSVLASIGPNLLRRRRVDQAVRRTTSG